LGTLELISTSRLTGVVIFRISDDAQVQTHSQPENGEPYGMRREPQTLEFCTASGRTALLLARYTRAALAAFGS
jgi:hypothetical protein